MAPATTERRINIYRDHFWREDRNLEAPCAGVERGPDSCSGSYSA